jgi:hypothetical protein
VPRSSLIHANLVRIERNESHKLILMRDRKVKWNSPFLKFQEPLTTGIAVYVVKVWQAFIDPAVTHLASSGAAIRPDIEHFRSDRRSISGRCRP